MILIKKNEKNQDLNQDKKTSFMILLLFFYELPPLMTWHLESDSKSLKKRWHIEMINIKNLKLKKIGVA